MKYIVIYWNDQENAWHVWTWETNKRYTEQAYRSCCEEHPKVKLIQVSKPLMEQNL